MKCVLVNLNQELILCQCNEQFLCTITALIEFACLLENDDLLLGEHN